MLIPDYRLEKKGDIRDFGKGTILLGQRAKKLLINQGMQDHPSYSEVLNGYKVYPLLTVHGIMTLWSLRSKSCYFTKEALFPTCL
jgi:hypothetical protein